MASVKRNNFSRFRPHDQPADARHGGHLSNQFRVRGKQQQMCAEGWDPVEEQVLWHILDDCLLGNGLGSSLIIKDANPCDVAHAVPLTHFTTTSFTASL